LIGSGRSHRRAQAGLTLARLAQRRDATADQQISKSSSAALAGGARQITRDDQKSPSAADHSLAPNRFHFARMRSN
jgi:hypothetical protein